ncbi:ParB/RepB/Spo0J family partition protein [Streptomyces ardesiacus]|uniref:ParB/RepB/Spo0J family partition protein n=1 Tax=Streptomyces ardesiacus TaxID=285564 RepID=UPI0036BD397C
MSKADRLGAGSAFGAATTARSSRRNLIDQTINGNSTPQVVTDLPVPLISDNPDNPRNHLRNLEETVASVQEVGIILPIVVATVKAYLKDRPDRADDLDDGAQYVVVDGHRRLESARRVGLATIPVRVDDARVSTDESLLEAAFIANYHRDDMTDLEEAHALKQLVDHYGSQTKASKRLGISQSNISSKLSLLKLTPELQKDLMTGGRKTEHVRNLGKLSPEEQKAKADERAAAARQKTPRSQPEVAERSAGPADYHGVIIPEAAAPELASVPASTETAPALSRAEPDQRPIAQPESTPPSSPVPAQTAAPEGRQPKMFPYHDGTEAAQLLLHKMPETELEKCLTVLLRHREKQTTS